MSQPSPAGLRPRLCLTLAGLVLTGLVACGSDEPTSQGNEVEGRAVETTTSTTSDTSTTTASSADEPATTTPPIASTPPPPTPAAGPGPLSGVQVTLTPVAEVEAPTKLVARPGSDGLYVAEQGGRVQLITGDGDPTTALDLSDQTQAEGEQGLLGLAFSPDGSTLYVHHSGTDGRTRVASFAMDGDVADPSSRIDLLEVDQPFPNHNGGDILVDDTGMLWIGLGDGGSGGDPDDRAQDPDDLLGKVLRIDPTSPSGGRAYGIPVDNPFASGGGRPEIALTGVRNPWRMRFDQGSGDLWIADVGQNEVEEINRVPAGSLLGTNLGWSRFEGSSTFDDQRDIQGPDPLGPVFEMVHDDGWCSVSGGPVYRGDAIPDLVGAYLFGDYCKTGLNAIRLDDEGVASESVVLDEDVDQVVSIDVGPDGELYVLSPSGTISRVDPAA